MIYILYYVEGHPGIPVERTFADHVIGHMFGFQQVIIDPSERFYASTNANPLVLRSLEEAHEHPWLKDLRWVYFHPQGEQTLQEYQHPVDDVVYCIGSDWTGFGMDVTSRDNADVVRVSAPDPSEKDNKREFFAAALIPIVVYDRAMKIWQTQHSHTI